MKCTVCSKKLTICNVIHCECNQTLCYTHRYFDKHSCTIDYKEKDRKILSQSLIKIYAEKIIKI